MSSDFASRMQNLWRDRFLQKNQEASQGLRALRAELVNPVWPQQLELSVLEASLLRSSGAIEKSNQVLKNVQEQAEDLPFQFYVQRGINLFIEGEYALALEYFIRAQKRSQNDFEDLAASSNILLCLENLNFDTSKKLKDVQTALTRLKDPEISSALEQHLLGFAQRQAFRSGQIRKIYKNSDETLNQAFFYRQWVAQLPYVRTAKKHNPSKLAVLFAEQNLHLKNFRMKTLLADSRLIDEEKIELREYIDRLYLWTWRWLTSDEDFHRENLKDCLGKFFSFQSFHKKMTGEDILMLRNSFQWILLFQPSMEKFLAPALNILRTLWVQNTPIFEIEEMLIGYLTALKKKDKAKSASVAKKIRAHALYQKQGLQFSILMKEFAKKIQSEKHLPNRTSIDPLTSKLVHNSEAIVSEPLVNLLLALLEKDSLLFAEALETAFHIRGYDEDVHKVKIHNLLSRLRENLPPDLKILTRQGRIYLQGDKKSVFVFSRTSSAPPLLEKATLPAEKLLIAEVKKASMDRWVHPHLVLKNAGGKKQFTRQDLQKMTKTSKATTNRWIQKWLDEGLLKKSGQGKSTLYLVEMS